MRGLALRYAGSGWFWAAFACPGSIILSGIVANFRDNWQLTAPEAWSCGLLFWFAKPKTVPAGESLYAMPRFCSAALAGMLLVIAIHSA